MITKATVLILGAGASNDFGFPLGVQLRDQLCRALEDSNMQQLLLELGHESPRLVEFSQQLRYSGYRSVDAFLEHNPEFLELGKQAMAATLLPFETERRLFPPEAPQENWYEFLANRMGAGSIDFAANQLSIITFNYDRSLEHYFTRVLAQRLRISFEDAYAQFKSIQVVHVHGTLGEYPSTAPDGLEYGTQLSAATVHRAATRIQVVSEVADNLPTFDKAYKLLNGAKRIFFLGFGFNADNVRRLRYFGTQRTGDDRPFVGGIQTGIHDKDWEILRSSVLNGNWSEGIYRGGVCDYFQSRADLS